MTLATAVLPQELGEVLDRLLASAGLRELAAPLLGADTDVQALADLSYAHPNGFDKLVLQALPGGQKIVLHAWWPTDGGVLEDGNFHDHRWHFATAVLTGTYRFIEYVERPDGPGTGVRVHKHEYTSPGAGSEHRLTPTGRMRLQPVKRDRLGAGSRYLLDCRVIHHIQLDEGVPTITLFVQGPPVRQSTRVFSQDEEPLGGEASIHRFTPDEYRARLGRALAAVELPSP